MAFIFLFRLSHTLTHLPHPLLLFVCVCVSPAPDIKIGQNGSTSSFRQEPFSSPLFAKGGFFPDEERASESLEGMDQKRREKTQQIFVCPAEEEGMMLLGTNWKAFMFPVPLLIRKGLLLVLGKGGKWTHVLHSSVWLSTDQNMDPTLDHWRTYFPRSVSLNPSRGRSLLLLSRESVGTWAGGVSPLLL